jgi:hypothetical protein
MRRIVIITATLLGSTLGAQAASHHPAQRPVASNSAGIDLPTAAMPPGFKAVFDDAINAIRRGSAHPYAHDGACLARQSQLADDIERLVPSGPVDVRQNPAMIELRTRCMPVNPNPPVDW